MYKWVSSGILSAPLMFAGSLSTTIYLMILMFDFHFDGDTSNNIGVKKK